MCWRTRPLSLMNSLDRFQSCWVVTAIQFHSKQCSSKIFHDVSVKVGLARGRALPDDLDDIPGFRANRPCGRVDRSEEHTSELQSRGHLVCRLLLEKKNNGVEQLISVYVLWRI